MRWIRYTHEGRTGYGTMQGDAIHQVAGGPFDGPPQPTGRVHALADVTIEVPVLPRTFYAAGLNYTEHVIEVAKKRGEAPSFPPKPDMGYRASNALVAHGQNVVIGDAPTRIREDALRILRFFRFHARFGEGRPDAAGLAACIASRASLGGLSRERVRAEFLKLLTAPGALGAVSVLDETGLLARITGGVAEAGRLSRAIGAGASAIGRLAALSVTTRADAERLAACLRLSKAEHAVLDAYARALAALKTRAAIDPPTLRALAAEHGPAALDAALAAVAGEPRPVIASDVAAAWRDLKDRPAPALPVTGAALVARGIPPGPRIGVALAAVRRHWLDQGCPSGPDAAEALIALALALDTEKPAEPRR